METLLYILYFIIGNIFYLIVYKKIKFNKKYKDIVKLSKIIGRPVKLDSSILFDNPGEEALDELIEVVYIKHKDYLKEQSIDKKELKNIYDRLIMGGAGQWYKGHYIPVSSIYIKETLTYLIENKTDSDLERASNLIVLFNSGKF
jgi:hypothetical protein